MLPVSGQWSSSGGGGDGGHVSSSRCESLWGSSRYGVKVVMAGDSDSSRGDGGSSDGGSVAVTMVV